jgi:DGQHR domain-containing protein
MFSLRAFHFQQKGFDLYVTTMSASQLSMVCTVDRWNPGRDIAYQRPELKRRFAEIARYLQREEGVLPTSILLSARPDARITIEPLNDHESPQIVKISFPDRCKLWIVDGQHRLGGLREASTGNPLYAEYLVPVTIMVCEDTYSELRMFNVINTRQKPIPKDIVDQHLRKMREIEGPDMQVKTSRRDYIRARATTIIELLNTLPCPWLNSVRIPNIQGREEGTMRCHSLVVSLEPIVEVTFVRGLSDQRLAGLLATYWRAIEALMPAAFLDPQDYTVQSHVGIHVFHSLFPNVVWLCQEVGDFSQKMMGRALTYLRLPTGRLAMDATSWHKLHGDPEIRDSRMGSMRALADNMRRYLPPPQLLLNP